MNILLVEPYYTGSHKSWAQGYQSFSNHNVQIISLPGQFWKWRMHGGAITLAKQFMDMDFSPDLILAMDMLDLTTFLSLTKSRTAQVPNALYFHENQLSCGPAWPLNEKSQLRAYSKYKTKRKIFHNCSGKHCGHLSVSKYKNLPIKNYQNKDHPIQKDLIKLIEDLSKYKIKNIGIDGCTLPNPLIPLKKFAFATAQLADYKKLNNHSAIAKRIFNSCIKFPEITGGSKSINSILTKLSNGKVFVKNGAEGIFVAIIPEKKSALAVKIIDGAARAAEVAIAGLLSELKIINNEKIKKRPIKNSAGQIIGSMKWIC